MSRSAWPLVFVLICCAHGSESPAPPRVSSEPSVPAPVASHDASRTPAPASDQLTIVRTFAGCIVQSDCAESMFDGEGARLWQDHVRSKKKAPAGAKVDIVARASDAYLARWSEIVEDLADGGYDRRELRALGAGSAVVSPAPRIALAMMAMKAVAEDSAQTEHAVVVLLQIGSVWKVVFWDDFPRGIKAFLLEHKASLEK